MKAGVAERLALVELVAEDLQLHVPQECFADLRDCHVPDGIQMAEFADDLYLLLAGGSGPAAWQAKITVRDGRAAERELKRADGELLTTAYTQPMEVHEGRISPEEKQRYFQDSKDSRNTAGRRGANL